MKRRPASSAPQYKWDYETDVVVVGYGGAGAAAAIEASDHGADVMVFDRFAGGGATALSGGVMYFGGGTELQKEAGFDDTPDNMYRYMRNEVGDAISDEAIRAFCDRSNENYEWIKSFGVPFPFRFEPLKTSYPSEETTLYYSGNETSPPNNELARPAPRGHRAFGKGLTGSVIFDGLRRAVEQRPIRVFPYASCTDLIRDDDGNVIGVEISLIRSRTLQALSKLLSLCGSNLGAISAKTVHACRDLLKRVESSGKTLRVRAKGGVVLAMGGFIFDTAETKTHIPQCEKTLRLGTIADDGRALTLGKRVGAGLRKMDRSAIWIFFNPPRAFLHGALIDRQGQRICNEELYGATVAMHMVENHERKGVLVIDHTIWKRIRHQLKTTKGAHFQVFTGFVNLFANRAKANSLQELERHCDMAEGSLKTAIEKYNQGVSAGQDEKGKSASLLEKIDTPPYYAINCDIGSARFMMPSMSLGGLAVDGLSAQVLREDGSPIEGLYAAGRSAAGISSHSYVTGLSIADAFFAGRNAGKSSALAAQNRIKVATNGAQERLSA